MRLVKLNNNLVVNLDNLTHADYGAPYGDKDGNLYDASLELNFNGDTPETNFSLFRDDAERVWAFLCNESHVLV